jgi:putative NIF3 family GTP cyclohydrolase 1 type 2
MKLESILQYLDVYLAVAEHPDYVAALNGLQVAGPQEIEQVVVAVDATEASIAEAAERGADLMIVHHGLFWGGLEPLTGRHFRSN